MRADDLIPWLIALLGGGSGLWGFLTARSKGKTDLVKVAQQAAADVIKDLRTDVDRAREQAEEAHEDAEKLRGRVTTLEEQLLQLSRDHEALNRANVTLQASYDQLARENQKLVGENDRLAQRVTDLEGELRLSKQTIESMTATSRN